MEIKLTKSLVPIIPKDHLDTVATDFLNEYFSEALLYPAQIPIEEIATNKMSLKLERVSITDDLSILGQMFFSDGGAEVYLKETDEVIIKNVHKGTMFIDPNVSLVRNIGSERNTIAHECVHWYMHRQYHQLAALAGNSSLAVASRCPVEEIKKNENKWDDVDWMEWQANGIAPTILMPKVHFINSVNKNMWYQKYLKRREEAMLDVLIAEIAEFYGVSKQSVSIRLKETGLI